MTVDAGARRNTDFLDQLSLSEAVSTALSRAIGALGDAPMQTGGLLAALAETGSPSGWDRIWPSYDGGADSQLAITDDAAAQDSGFSWHEAPLSQDLLSALRLLALMAGKYQMNPVQPGAVVLALAAVPDSGAARRLRELSGCTHVELLDRIQSDLLGVTLDGLGELTRRWTVREAIARRGPAPPGSLLVRWLAASYAVWVSWLAIRTGLGGAVAAVIVAVVALEAVAGALALILRPASTQRPRQWLVELRPNYATGAFAVRLALIGLVTAAVFLTRHRVPTLFTPTLFVLACLLAATLAAATFRIRRYPESPMVSLSGRARDRLAYPRLLGAPVVAAGIIGLFAWYVHRGLMLFQPRAGARLSWSGHFLSWLRGSLSAAYLGTSFGRAYWPLLVTAAAVTGCYFCGLAAQLLAIRVTRKSGLWAAGSCVAGLVIVFFSYVPAVSGLTGVAGQPGGGTVPGYVTAGSDADRAAAASLPYGALGGSSLGSVACPGPLACVATGDYTDQAGRSQVLLLTTSGGQWYAQAAPLPRHADETPGAQVDAGSIACPAPTECVATGSYQDAASHSLGMLLTESGSAWSANRTPVPAGGDGGLESDLHGVTCANPSSCVAVGAYADDAGQSHGMLVIGARSSWAAIRAPLPAGVPSGQAASVRLVTCGSASSCVAIGTYTDNAGNDKDFLLAGANRSWAAIAAPLPGGAAAPGAPPSISLNAIACPAVSECIVTGTYAGSTGLPQGVILTGNGTSWTARKVPLPPGTDAPYGTTSNAVACATPAMCVITAGYTDSDVHSHGMLIVSVRGGWKSVPMPLPADADPANPSYAGYITCPAAGSCIAAGRYTDSGGYAHWMLLSGSASAWTPVEVVMPPGSGPVKASDNPGGIETIACFIANECLAAGTYTDSSGQNNALLVSPFPAPSRWPAIYLNTSFTRGVYTYPGFPAFIGVDNHSYIDHLRWEPIGGSTETATGTLHWDNCTPDCASGREIASAVGLIASAPQQCTVDLQVSPLVAVKERVFAKITITAGSDSTPRWILGSSSLSPGCQDGS